MNDRDPIRSSSTRKNHPGISESLAASAAIFFVCFSYKRHRISTGSREEEAPCEEVRFCGSVLPGRRKKALKSLINCARRQLGDRCTPTMHRSGCPARSRNSGANVVSCKRSGPVPRHPALPIRYRGRWHY